MKRTFTLLCAMAIAVTGTARAEVQQAEMAGYLLVLTDNPHLD